MSNKKRTNNEEQIEEAIYVVDFVEIRASRSLQINHSTVNETFVELQIKLNELMECLNDFNLHFKNKI